MFPQDYPVLEQGSSKLDFIFLLIFNFFFFLFHFVYELCKLERGKSIVMWLIEERFYKQQFIA